MTFEDWWDNHITFFAHEYVKQLEEYKSDMESAWKSGRAALVTEIAPELKNLEEQLLILQAQVAPNGK